MLITQWQLSAINPSTSPHPTKFVLITHLQVRTTKPNSPTLWHVLKKSDADLVEQDFPVKWFKFIYLRSKLRMTETSICTHVHVAYSPLASMNHQWTINLNDGYPSFHALMPVEYIPPLIPTLCNLCLPCFTLVLISFTPPQTPNMIFPV